MSSASNVLVASSNGERSIAGQPSAMLEEYLSSPPTITENLHRQAVTGGKTSKRSKKNKIRNDLDKWQRSWDESGSSKS
ncbi:hypothetical protein CH063_03701 [Colletotrichum higginsianum]|uniref:Uncharacterized protein n=1 Tax=Colletotrichum higginsianum (strain IMI 349063) TaxID=759273 RepID=H1VZZ3_COLHI|nr:hypothetical protein CH63R_06186 [Colletotrichum higginsianum IMI 349063]OBR10494.1 hypothetical protein CH63R_06186 [Colletotrichum higginsianum IMI 349063]CCF45805.1 hypothetical protein CH063_03701 [Colletotrichum higginsianum]